MPPLVDIQSLLGIIGQDQQRQEAARRQGMMGAELGLREQSLNMQGQQNQAEMAERQQARELQTKLTLAELLGGEKAAKATQEYQMKVLAQNEYESAQNQAAEEKRLALDREKLDWTKEIGLKSLAAGQEQNQAENLLKMLGMQQKPAGTGQRTLPSAGNAVDLAIMRKFGVNSLSDPSMGDQFGPWLDSEEGRQAVQAAARDTTVPSFTPVATGEGITPFQTRGAGAGTFGEPTGLGKPMPEGMLASKQLLGMITKSQQEVEKDYDPSYVGFVQGRLGKLGEKTIGVGEKRSRFYANLAQMRSSYIYLLSGKQISEPEYQRLLEAFPVESMPESTFKARMDNFGKVLSYVSTLRDKETRGYSSSGATGDYGGMGSAPATADPLGIR